MDVKTEVRLMKGEKGVGYFKHEAPCIGREGFEGGGEAEGLGGLLNLAPGLKQLSVPEGEGRTSSNAHSLMGEGEGLGLIICSQLQIDRSDKDVLVLQEAEWVPRLFQLLRKRNGERLVERITNNNTLPTECRLSEVSGIREGPTVEEGSEKGIEGVSEVQIGFGDIPKRGGDATVDERADPSL